MAVNNWELLLDTAKSFNIMLSEKQILQYKLYCDFLDKYNEHTNIVSSSDQKTVIVKHFIDSLSLGLLKDSINFNNPLKIIDMGSGGGFPGIPLIISYPNWKLCAVDSVGKKTKFIELLVKELDIEGRVEVLTARAEELGQNDNYRETFDIAVSRAVSQLPALCEYCIPFVKNNGIFIAYKARQVDEELKQSIKAINTMGGELKETVSYFLPEDEQIERKLIVIKKIKPTPASYPRKTGVPKKSPII